MARTVFKLGAGVFGLVLAMVMVVGLASPSFASAYMKPTVTHLNPTSGTTLGGNTVTITGRYYTGFGQSLVKTVWFGGTWKGTNIHVLANGLLTVTAPRGAGTKDVRVVTVAGMSAASSADLYTFGAPVSAVPVVSSVSPTSGSTLGGTSVTITGSNLLGATTVWFGGTWKGTNIQVQTNSQLTVTAPRGLGTKDVRVVTAAGMSSVSSADLYTFVAPVSTVPVVTSVSPSSGSTLGGTSVTITGSNLLGATGVMFGTTPALFSTSTDGTSITAQAPAGTVGMVDVTVTTPAGTSAVSAADQFTYVANAAVSSISPSTGPAVGGTSVTITGTSFTGATKVMFGANAATSFTVNSDTSITAQAPAGTVGMVDVTVTTPIGTSAKSAADEFTYSGPVVTGVTPATAASGLTGITITGTGFTGATKVMFGTNAATITAGTATSITVTAPAGSGTVDVTVTTASGTSATSLADHFTYAPVITSLSPAAGSLAGGTSVTITGSGFEGASAVNFGGTAATSFFVNSDTSITAVAPMGSSTVAVTVTTAAGTSSSTQSTANTYTYGTTVTGVSPNYGPTAGGNNVTITGSGFEGATGASAVTFGGTNATNYVVVSDTQILATVPTHAAGTVLVKVTNAGSASSSTLSAANEYTYGVPVVNSVTEANGPAAGGNSVTLAGTGFTGATKVMFGTTAATSFTVISDTSITAVVPAGSGTVNVTVTSPLGTSTGTASYTYNAAVTVSKLDVTSGPAAGSTTVKITGTGFTGATKVMFGSNAASFFVNNSTTITAISPAGTGTVDVTVTTPAGTSATSSDDQYTYGPVVTSLSPNNGPLIGGNTVKISGSGFTGATHVYFGGTTAATNFVIANDSTIYAVAPSSTATTVVVTVTTPAGESATTGSSANNYTYNPAPVAPAISSVDPTSGPSTGGATVKIVGTDFTGATAVNFGTTAASQYLVEPNGTTILAKAPAGTGTVVVTVTTPAGTSTTTGSTSNEYTYTVAPTVTSLSQSSGSPAGGTSVTITGTGFFGGGTASAVTAVMFGTKAGTITGTTTDTSITATAPAGSGTVDVTVVTPNGTSATSSADQYSYVTSVSSITSPAYGPAVGGNTVTINGSGFGALDNTTTTVKFGSTPATDVTVKSDTLLTAVAPAGTGTVDVTVTTPDGGTSAVVTPDDEYTYAPTVTGISPNMGAAAGGTPVTISGTGFDNVASTGAVMFGTQSATSYAVMSDNAIVATAPANDAPGAVVDVVVTDKHNQASATSAADEFTYAPAISSITVASGTSTAPTSVTISGTGFTSTTTVMFGTTPATVTGYDLTGTTGTLTVTVPTGTTYPVNVTATNVAGKSPVYPFALPTAIAKNTGDGQTATAGSAVSIAPSVLVTDANGNPVAGVSVTFAVATGGGSLTGASATTNASGIATVGSWTLGTTAGANTLTATAAGLSGSPVTFTATGIAGAASTIAVNAGDNQTVTTTGTAVPINPSVVIKDANGNPVAGVSVTFAVATGGGSVTGASATTDASGIATVGSWTLGTTAGANTLTATATGLTGSPVTFTATN